MQEPRTRLGVAVACLAFHVVSDALRHPVDGLVDLDELRQPAEVCVPVEKFVERLMDDLITGALVIEEQSGQTDEARVVLAMDLGPPPIPLAARRLRTPVPCRRHVRHHH